MASHWNERFNKFDVDGLLFTRDNRYLLTGSVDQTNKFWHMKTGQFARDIVEGKTI